MRVVSTEIVIKASKDQVWSVLMDFKEYPKWNPFVTNISGSNQIGDKLVVSIAPPDGKKMIFKPKVTLNEENKCFAWLGHLLIPGLFDGRHIFRLEDLGPHETRFCHSEEFSGILVPLLGSMFPNVEKGFQLMNQALKKQVEQR